MACGGCEARKERIAAAAQSRDPRQMVSAAGFVAKTMAKDAAYLAARAMNIRRNNPTGKSK